MKNRLFLCLFLLIVLFGAGAQNFKPFTRLRTIQTEHFEIIFPAESEATAGALSLCADALYEKVSGLLGISLERRIPVTITPHQGQFNAYMNPLPYPHIVLFDTPMDVEWTAFRNSLESLFLHELTHAVSLSSRGPFFKGLHKIFGGWVYPTGINAPLFMVEGVTVSFESLDGFGRANDPLIKQYLRQAIHEDSFLTPFQASGVYDLPPSNSAYYYYGGLFSAYLQKTYGMEKYAELWQAMGRKLYVSLFVYRSGFYRIFTKVYGIPFMDAWTAFKEDLALSGIMDNKDGIIRSGKSLIADIAAGNGGLYVLDQTGQRLLFVDPRTGREERVFSADSSAYQFSLSPDGKHGLLSAYRYAGDLASARVSEYDLSSGRRTGRFWKGLYKGAYFRDGVIGLNSELHANALVYISGSGNERVLLRGNGELLFSNPCPVNDSWIALIAAERGLRSIWLCHFESGKVVVLKSDLEDDLDYWQYIRGLHVSGERLLFSYNHDDRMYKLGMIDLGPLMTEEGPFFHAEAASLDALFTEYDFSGGVFDPVVFEGALYYRGAFSSWDALMKYPEPMDRLSGLAVKVYGEERDVRGSASSPGPASAAEYSGVPEGASGDSPAETRNFNALKYMNPLKLWLPYPLMGIEDGKVRFSGAGIFSYLSDPTDRHTVFLTAGWDFREAMAPVDISWTNLSFGFPLVLNVSDSMSRGDGTRSKRISQAVLTGSFSRGIGGERVKLGISAGLGFGMNAEDPGGGSSAYTWQYDDPYYSSLLGLGLSSLRQYGWELFGRGLSLNVYARQVFGEKSLRIEGLLSAAFEPFLPLRFTLYGAWDAEGMNLWGESDWFASVYFDEVASAEYAGPKGFPFPWLGGGEAELKLFAFELQRNLSHVYFNRPFCTLAYRAVLYDGQGYSSCQGTRLGSSFLLAQSALLRIGSVISIVPIKALPIRLVPSFWAAWKFSNTINRDGEDFVWGFSLSLGW